MRRHCVSWRMRRVVLNPSGGNDCAETGRGSWQWGTAQAPDVVDVASTADPSRVSKEAMAKAQRMAAIQAKIASQMQSLGSVPGLSSGVGMVSVPGATSMYGAGFQAEGLLPSSHPIWSYQFGEPGLLFSSKLTNLYRRPSMTT